MPGGEPRDAHRRRGEHQQDDDEQRRRDGHEDGPGLPRGVAHDADRGTEQLPVADRVERAVQRPGEADVEGPHHGHTGERQPGEHCETGPRRPRQDDGQRDDRQGLDGDPQEGRRRDRREAVRGEQHGPQQSRRGDPGRAAHDQAGAGVPGRPDQLVAGGRRRRGPRTPQPDDVAAERLDEQHEGQRDRGACPGGGQHAGSGHGEHDALDRRHRLAPVAPWQPRAHPRQDPRDEEGVAHQPDREDPDPERPGDQHAEDEDEEGVDLPVEARTQRRHGAGAPGGPPVDGVEGQPHGGQGDDHGQRSSAPGARRHEGGHAAGERRPDERDPVRPAERRRPRPGEGPDHQRAGRQAAGEAHRPAGAGQADRAVERGEQRDRGDEARRRPSRHSAHPCPLGSTGTPGHAGPPSPVHLGGGCRGGGGRAQANHTEVPASRKAPAQTRSRLTQPLRRTRSPTTS